MNTGRKPKGRDEKNAFKLKDKIDRCVSMLKEPYDQVFRNTYLKDEDRYWWTGYFSSSSYYRYLKEARIQFFKIFYRGNV